MGDMVLELLLVMSHDVSQKGGGEEMIADIPGVESQATVGVASLSRRGGDLGILDHLERKDMRLIGH